MKRAGINVVVRYKRYGKDIVRMKEGQIGLEIRMEK